MNGRCAMPKLTDLQVMTRGVHMQTHPFSTMQKWWRMWEPLDACKVRHNKLADHSRSDRPGACHVSMFEFVFGDCRTLTSPRAAGIAATFRSSRILEAGP